VTNNVEHFEPRAANALSRRPRSDIEALSSDQCSFVDVNGVRFSRFDIRQYWIEDHIVCFGITNIASPQKVQFSSREEALSALKQLDASLGAIQTCSAE
jgi:hypothetical protein